MSQSSSISSSDESRARHYLAIVAGVAGALMIGAVVLSVLGLRYGLFTWHFSQLLHYQIDKLERAEAVDVLLVGDSSLGNAVDARTWSRDLDRPVLSLALTGTYGYGGSLNMIRRTLRRNAPKAIVLFHTVKLMAREDQGQGALMTAENLSDLDVVRPSAIWSSLVNLAMPFNVAGSLLWKQSDKRASYIETDYVPQAAPWSQTRSPPPPAVLDPSGLVAEHRRFLEAIGKLCAQYAVPCLYVHGPLGQWECDRSERFVAAVNTIVKDSGLTPVAGTPVCIAWPELGDAEDHVHPAAKARFSARYLALVAPFLGDKSR
jgi:hypothetical protein